MRIKFNKEIEFFLKKNFLSQSYLLKKRLERSVKNNEEEELKLVKEFIIPGTDTIDVGVYRGVYSFEMSKYSNLVHAFEPNPLLFINIEKNLKKIIKNINFYNYALSDQDGLISLKVPIRNKNHNKENYEEYFQMGKASIHNKNEMNEFELFDIKRKKLDDFSFSNKISFIKIDVEGHEFFVLKGLEDSLNSIKVIQFEFGGTMIDSRTFFQDFYYFFTKNDFEIYRIKPIGLQKLDEYKETDEYFKYSNFIAVNKKLSFI